MSGLETFNIEELLYSFLKEKKQARKHQIKLVHCILKTNKQKRVVHFTLYRLPCYSAMWLLKY